MSRHPLRPAWLNDRSPGIASVWEATRAYPDELQRLVREFVPNVPDYRAFSAHIWARDYVPNNPDEIIELGFHQLAVATMRWSGYGGSPRGGYDQKHYPRIGERWSIPHMTRKIKMFSDRLKHAHITNMDFALLIEDTQVRAFLFLDPPYMDVHYYDYDFTQEDHLRLAHLLYENDQRRERHKWLLTYHDHPVVHELYKWARIVRIPGASMVRTPSGWVSKRDTLAIMGN